jgi:hypothetical protein
MYLCVICRFAVELDDAVVPTPSGNCVCVRCFARETETAVVMDRDFKHSIETVLTEMDLAQSLER